MSSPCTEIQERIVASERLGETEQAHVLDCPRCSRLTADCLVLDGLVVDGLDGTFSVPDDFADRVMGQLEVDAKFGARWDDMLGRRWVQIALANVSVAFAVVNLFRFVFSALIPTTSLGGLP
jgi:hypothetical protein